MEDWCHRQSGLQLCAGLLQMQHSTAELSSLLEELHICTSLTYLMVRIRSTCRGPSFLLKAPSMENCRCILQQQCHMHSATLLSNKLHSGRHTLNILQQHMPVARQTRLMSVTSARCATIWSKTVRAALLVKPLQQKATDDSVHRPQAQW